MHPTPQRLAVLNVTSVRRVSFVTPFIVVDINDPPPSHGFLKAFFYDQRLLQYVPKVKCSTGQTCPCRSRFFSCHFPKTKHALYEDLNKLQTPFEVQVG